VAGVDLDQEVVDVDLDQEVVDVDLHLELVDAEGLKVVIDVVGLEVMIRDGLEGVKNAIDIEEMIDGIMIVEMIIVLVVALKEEIEETAQVEKK